MLAVVRADLVDRDDARVVEEGDGLGLVPEPAQLVVAGEQAGPDHLEGDGSIERDLSGLVDDAHAAAAEFAADLVVAEVADPVAARQGVRVAVAARRGGGAGGVGLRAVDGRARVGRPDRLGGAGVVPGRRRVLHARRAGGAEDVVGPRVGRQQRLDAESQAGVAAAGPVQVGRCAPPLRGAAGPR